MCRRARRRRKLRCPVGSQLPDKARAVAAGRPSGDLSQIHALLAGGDFGRRQRQEADFVAHLAAFGASLNSAPTSVLRLAKVCALWLLWRISGGGHAACGTRFMFSERLRKPAQQTRRDLTGYGLRKQIALAELAADLR